jgi:gamma-butyrobetaine dioxygenase
MNCVQEIIELLDSRAGASYFGEAVTQREHALQAALLAVMDGADDDLIAAALLHDIAYWIGCGDTPHEQAGSDWLGQRFVAGVSEPVRLHVAAKRYLCTVDSAYAGRLSRASVFSLEVQGGLMGIEELRSFESNPYHRHAVRLRIWDDRAKVPGAAVKDPREYMPIPAASNAPGKKRRSVFQAQHHLDRSRSRL